MQVDLAVLPVRLASVQAESGLGFLLRACSANGHSLANLRQRLGVRDWRSLKPSHVASLAHCTQCSPDWLLASLMIRSIESPEHFTLGGVRFRAASADSNLGAKVCPACLQEQRWCRRTWLLPGAVACWLHQRPLIDSCSRCLRAIAWRRPSIDVCSCGRYLTDNAPAAGGRGNPITEAWTKWLDDRLARPGSDDSDESSLIPRMLNCLSIDGATALAFAFGILDRPTTTGNTSKKNARTVLYVSETLQRGLSRLAEVDGAPHLARRWSPYVHTPTLERLRRKGVTDADRNCAALMLFYTSSRSNRTNGGRHTRGQMELFR